VRRAGVRGARVRPGDPGRRLHAPDDTPTIKVGATIFADSTVQEQPRVTDADGNTVTSNSFNVSRSYINVTRNKSHLVAFRITPDISRETGTGTSLNGSYPLASHPGASIEALFRYDNLEPNRDLSGTNKRTIAGIAYCFPHQGGASTALMLDVDNTTFCCFTPSNSTQRRIAPHALVNF
jgi:hypothetical protein